MKKNQFFYLTVSLIAIGLFAGFAYLIQKIYQGDTTLLQDVTVAGSTEMVTFSPNADGVEDAVTIRYSLAKPADVSIYLTPVDDPETKFYFRQEKPRSPGAYSVNFSGVVEAYELEGDNYQVEILSRIVQNGLYDLHIDATSADDGQTMSSSIPLMVEDADVEIPELAGLSIFPKSFSPNRDGITDRVKINFDLIKGVEKLRVYTVVADGLELDIKETPQDIIPSEGAISRFPAGFKLYDYDAGVDSNAEPPAPGTYPIIIEAEDAEGQKVRIYDEVTIEEGSGIPFVQFKTDVPGEVVRAGEVGQSGDNVVRTLRFSTTAIRTCETLEFEITVENYGTAPVRTTGPESGAIYDSDENYNTAGWPTESGAFRVGIGYENQLSDYPFRWALGTLDQLTKIGEHFYLMPGQQVVVRGGIRIVESLGNRDPQPFFAGLIHEDVAISQFNGRVDTQAIDMDYSVEADCK